MTAVLDWAASLKHDVFKVSPGNEFGHLSVDDLKNQIQFELRRCRLFRVSCGQALAVLGVCEENQIMLLKRLIAAALTSSESAVVADVSQFAPSEAVGFVTGTLKTFLQSAVKLYRSQHAWKTALLDLATPPKSGERSMSTGRGPMVPPPMQAAIKSSTLKLVMPCSFRFSAIKHLDLRSCTSLQLRERAFGHMAHLEKALLPETITALPYKLFVNSGIKRIEAKGVRSIHAYAFFKCGRLEECDFGSDTLFLGVGAFAEAKALSFFRTDLVHTFSSSCFRNSGIVHAVLSAKCIFIDRAVFQGSSIVTADFGLVCPLTFAGAVRCVADCVCLRTVVLPPASSVPCKFAHNSGVVRVVGRPIQFEESSFDGAFRLTTVDVLARPNSVKIGANAFKGTALQGAVFVHGPGKSSFEGVSGPFSVIDAGDCVQEHVYENSGIIAFAALATLGGQGRVSIHKISTPGVPPGVQVLAAKLL